MELTKEHGKKKVPVIAVDEQELGSHVSEVVRQSVEEMILPVVEGHWIKSGKSRQRYSQQYKTESLTLAEKVGGAAAARQLGLHESQLYNWRSKARLAQDRSAVEERLLVENARLKRQLAECHEELSFIKKAAAYFAKNLKCSTLSCKAI